MAFVEAGVWVLITLGLVYSLFGSVSFWNLYALVVGVPLFILTLRLLFKQ